MKIPVPDYKSFTFWFCLLLLGATIYNLCRTCWNYGYSEALVDMLKPLPQPPAPANPKPEDN